MIKYTRKFGDRYDGYRLKNIDPFSFIVPHVMKYRADSQVYFTNELDITELEAFVREHANSDIPGLKMYHVIIAAAMRTYALRPYLNRFVMHGKLFQRNHLCVSMAIKRRSDKEETTTLKVAFDHKDTLKDVVDKFNRIVELNKEELNENGTDKVAKLLGSLPSWLVRGAINFLWWLDKHGKMPKIINKVSPFHTGLFITNMGSLGIPPVYHHIYDFGTTSVFVAMGNKTTKYELNEKGEIEAKRKMTIKVVADERICDGAYYAGSMRMMSRFIKNPSALMTPPEKIVVDDGIVMKGRKSYEVTVGEEVEL
ncbi:MAG: 2-oxo acid dehydrogenase subunit E2 [Ruminococcaceae bacterium]|nr:2-oxo acid dehydrogenase subunit E2 [Oscillospiraceae bacterium]